MYMFLVHKESPLCSVSKRKYEALATLTLKCKLKTNKILEMWNIYYSFFKLLQIQQNYLFTDDNYFNRKVCKEVIDTKKIFLSFLIFLTQY